MLKFNNPVYHLFFKAHPYSKKMLKEAIQHAKQQDTNSGLLKMRLLIEQLVEDWHQKYDVNNNKKYTCLFEAMKGLAKYDIPDYIIGQLHLIRSETNIGVHTGNEEFLGDNNVETTLLAFQRVAKWYVRKHYPILNYTHPFMILWPSNLWKKIIGLMGVSIVVFMLSVGGWQASTQIKATQKNVIVYQCGNSSIYHTNAKHAALQKRCTKELIQHTIEKAKNKGLIPCKCKW